MDLIEAGDVSSRIATLVIEGLRRRQPKCGFPWLSLWWTRAHTSKRFVEWTGPSSLPSTSQPAGQLQQLSFRPEAKSLASTAGLADLRSLSS